MDLKGLLARWLPKIAPWAALMGGLTMLQIGEYATGEILLVASSAAFLYQVFTYPTAKLQQLFLILLVVVLNGYFMLVVYRSKGDRPWSNLLAHEQFKVTIGPGVRTPAWNESALYLYLQNTGKGQVLCPINSYHLATIINTSPYPIRILTYSARIKKDAGWLTPWDAAVVMPLGGAAVVSSRESDKYTPNDMFRIVSPIPSLDSTVSHQIEAARTFEGWFALEYPDHMVLGNNYKIEIKITSDVAGSAIGYLDGSAKKDLGSTVFLNPKLFMVPPYPKIDLGSAEFWYYSDLMSAMR